MSPPSRSIARTSRLGLDAIRSCLEGAVPSPVATCDAEGTPNVTYVSQVHYVDREHVALSFQFFNKTRKNVLENPQVTVFLEEPHTAERYRLALLHRRTETEGPIFEAMRAKLAGIASQTGMTGVFRLRGADIYQVLDIEYVPGDETAAAPRTVNLLAAARAASDAFDAAPDLDGLLDATTTTLAKHFAVPHVMVLLADAAGEKLFTVASHGYGASGVGSEIRIGQGLIGIAALSKTPLRTAHVTQDITYSHAARDDRDAAGAGVETEIPFPGIARPNSQVSVPFGAGGRLLGVLYVESDELGRFGYDEEDALVLVARLLGEAMARLGRAAAQADASAEADQPSRAPRETPASLAPPTGARPSPAPLRVKHYAENDSVFLDDEYLIKGVAGAILWRLLEPHRSEGRAEFTNRELRLDRAIGLPEVGDNLEARLVLLQRRLVERSAALRLEKTGRGRFRLVLDRSVSLSEVPRG